METFFLLALAAMGVDFFRGDPTDDGDQKPASEDAETGDEPVNLGPIPVIANNTAQGTAGADIFTLVPRQGGVENAEASAGNGNDTLDLFDETYVNTSPTDDRTLIGSRIFGGDGDDYLQAFAMSSRIEMDDGQDTVELVFGSLDSAVDLGGGDDIFSGQGGFGPLTIVTGGTGNDTLGGSFNLYLQGGPGDDTIRFSGEIEGTTGYATRVDGGEGSDTIAFSGQGITNPSNSALRPEGGPGADLFDLDISEGDPAKFYPDYDYDPQDFVQADDSLLFEVLRLPDFTPGEDMIQVDATASGEGYDLASARLETGTDFRGDPITTLILRYAHAIEPDQETTVVIESGDVDWEDIIFVGADIPALVPFTPNGS